MLISNVVYAPASFVTNWIINRYGFKNGIWIGTIITTAALWIRVFCDHGFTYIFVGQSLASVAQSFFYGTGQKVSVTWFNEKQRGFATSLILGLMPIGNIVGALLPRFFVDPLSSGATLMGELKQMLLVSAYIGSGLTVLIFIFFREKPKTPPSKAAEIPRHDYKKSLKDAFKNKNLMWALFTQSLFAGIGLTFGVIAQPLLAPFGVNQNHLTSLIGVSVPAGFAMNIIGTCLIHKTKKYKFWLFIFNFVSNFFIMAMIFCRNMGSPMLLVVLSMLNGLFSGATIPSTFEFFVELSFPVAEEIPGSLYSLGYQLLSTGICLWLADMIDGGNPDDSVKAMWIIFGSGVVSICLFLFTKEDLRRTRMEKEHKSGTKKDEAPIELELEDKIEMVKEEEEEVEKLENEEEIDGEMDGTTEVALEGKSEFVQIS